MQKNIKMYRYFLISISLFLTILGTFLYRTEGPDYKATVNNKPACDTTIVPPYSLYDIANTINSDFSIDKKYNRLFYLSIDNQADTTLAIYDKNLQKFSFLTDSTFKNAGFTMADTIAFKALIDQNSRLYDRWSLFLGNYRNEFVKKRKLLFDSLSPKLPGYNFTFISDYRNADDQASLLKAGKSATPLSAHQFGLATDVAIKHKGRYLTGYIFYKIMGEMAIDKGLVWGGKFVGFVDPGHIQLFENSAKMLVQIPELRYEFEPFRQHYYKRIEKFIAAGKEKYIEDTKELIEVMDLLKDGRLCACKKNDAGSNTLIEKLKIEEFDPKTDVLVFMQNQDLVIYRPDSGATLMKLGTWN